MRCFAIIGAILILCGAASAQKHPPSPEEPTQFEIGRRTFFDFGPPFNFYELFLVRPTANGTSVNRITLTPTGMGCNAHPIVETKSATIAESLQALMGTTNPCTIPEKQLRHELKRCNKCRGFSGAVVVMQVRCGDQPRFIRSDILDRDMFDPGAKTPEHTSWTMKLLETLDRAMGPSPMDKPIFSIGNGKNQPIDAADAPILEDVSAGKYDQLFQGAPDKPSDLHHAYSTAPDNPPQPSVRLVSSVPIDANAFIPPIYPPTASAARSENRVSATIQIGANGNVTSVLAYTGQPIFRRAVENAVLSWRFPLDAANLTDQVIFEFTMKCPEPHDLPSSSASH